MANFNFWHAIVSCAVQKNQIIILVTSISSIVLLLVVGIYLLVNSTSNEMPSGMIDMMGGLTTSNTELISIILIASAISVSIAIVGYFLFYSRNKKNEITKLKFASLDSVIIKDKMSTGYGKRGTIVEDSRPFDVFLCYKKSSGRDYADHLKAGLEELGLHTFEDWKDIPQTVYTEEGWDTTRDKAIQQSKYFVLIMTPGFDLSSEVIKEIGMARKQANKIFVFFRHRSMGRKIVVNLGDEILDIGKLEQVSFESKEELLRLAHNILVKDKTP